MNNIGNQISFLHNLLPYLPSQSRMLFFFLLYILEFQRMMNDFKRDSDILSHSPPNSDFPDLDTLLKIMSKDMPGNDMEKIKKMIELMKMMEMMDDAGAGFANEEKSKSEAAGKNTKADNSPSGINSSMLKRMMSPKQQEMFEKYQDMFKHE